MNEKYIRRPIPGKVKRITARVLVPLVLLAAASMALTSIRPRPHTPSPEEAVARFYASAAAKDIAALTSGFSFENTDLVNLAAGLAPDRAAEVWVPLKREARQADTQALTARMTSEPGIAGATTGQGLGGSFEPWSERPLELKVVVSSLRALDEVFTLAGSADCVVKTADGKADISIPVAEYARDFVSRLGDGMQFKGLRFVTSTKGDTADVIVMGTKVVRAADSGPLAPSAAAARTLKVMPRAFRLVRSGKNWKIARFS